MARKAVGSTVVCLRRAARTAAAGGSTVAICRDGSSSWNGGALDSRLGFLLEALPRPAPPPPAPFIASSISLSACSAGSGTPTAFSAESCASSGLIRTSVVRARSAARSPMRRIVGVAVPAPISTMTSRRPRTADFHRSNACIWTRVAASTHAVSLNIRMFGRAACPQRGQTGRLPRASSAFRSIARSSQASGAASQVFSSAQGCCCRHCRRWMLPCCAHAPQGDAPGR